MEKIFICVLLVNLLAIGTAFASPQKTTENSNVSTYSIGFIDLTKIMRECSQVKTFEEELTAKGIALNNEIEADKPNLTSGEIKQRKEAMYNQFMRAKQEMETNINQKIQVAMSKVATEKKLMVILYKSSVAFGGIDVTMDVMNTME